MRVMINIDTWTCKKHDMYAGQWHDKRVRIKPRNKEGRKDHQGTATSGGSLGSPCFSRELGTIKAAWFKMVRTIKTAWFEV